MSDAIPIRYVSLAGPKVRDLIEALQLLDPDWTVPVSELRISEHAVVFEGLIPRPELDVLLGDLYQHLPESLDVFDAIRSRLEEALA